MDKISNIQALRAALAVSPQNVPLLKMYGEACVAEWSLKEARETFEKILALVPDDFEAKLAVARILYQMGNISESAVRAESLSKEQPDSAEVWLLLSKLAVSEGNREQARSYFLKSREIDPAVRDGALEKEFHLNLSPAESTDENKQKIMNSDAGWEPEEEDFSLQPQDSVEELSADEPERPQITFGDIGGMEDVKEEIRMKILYPMKKPELFRAYGKKMGGGVARDRDIAKVFRRNPPLLQGLLESLLRQAGRMFHPIQPFFFAGVKELSIGQHHSGRIAVIGVDSENIQIFTI